MLIDWFTVAAQGLNFVVLLWLLKRFLYKPITNAVEAREKHIADELADAATKRTAAEGEREAFQNKTRVLNEQRSILLKQASEEAKAETARLIGAARADADRLRASQDAAMRGDWLRLSDELSRLAKGEVFAIARKALGDLATVSLEERMGEVFTRRLREMNDRDKDGLGAALRAAIEPAVVRSTFAMSAGPRAAIQNALNETFAAEIRVVFETASDSVCGIELVANGYKTSWSIAEYLKSLEHKVGDLLDARSTSGVVGNPRIAPPLASIPAGAK